MNEILEIPVMVPSTDDEDDEKNLQIENDCNCLTFKIDGKELFKCDYNFNFANVAERMLEIWGKPGDDE